MNIQDDDLPPEQRRQQAIARAHDAYREWSKGKSIRTKKTVSPVAPEVGKAWSDYRTKQLGTLGPASKGRRYPKSYIAMLNSAK